MEVDEQIEIKFITEYRDSLLDKINTVSSSLNECVSSFKDDITSGIKDFSIKINNKLKNIEERFSKNNEQLEALRTELLSKQFDESNFNNFSMVRSLDKTVAERDLKIKELESRIRYLENNSNGKLEIPKKQEINSSITSNKEPLQPIPILNTATSRQTSKKTIMPVVNVIEKEKEDNIKETETSKTQTIDSDGDIVIAASIKKTKPKPASKKTVPVSNTLETPIINNDETHKKATRKIKRAIKIENEDNDNNDTNVGNGNNTNNLVNKVADVANVVNNVNNVDDVDEQEAKRIADDEALKLAEDESLEAEQLEAKRIADDEALKLAEEESLEAERLEAERLEAEQLEAERLEAERLEAERLEQQKAEEVKNKKSDVVKKKVIAKKDTNETSTIKKKNTKSSSVQQPLTAPSTASSTVITTPSKTKLVELKEPEPEPEPVQESLQQVIKPKSSLDYPDSVPEYENLSVITIDNNNYYCNDINQAVYQIIPNVADDIGTFLGYYESQTNSICPVK